MHKLANKTIPGILVYVCGGTRKWWSWGKKSWVEQTYVVISDIPGTEVDNYHFKSRSDFYIKIVYL